MTNAEKIMLAIIKKYGRVSLCRNSNGIVVKCTVSGGMSAHSGYSNDPDASAIMETYLVLGTIMWDAVDEL